MTEKKLSSKGGKQLRLPKVMVAVGLVAAGFAVLWAVRKPAAQGLIEVMCSRLDVACSANIARLDFGGISLRALKISEVSGATPIISIDRLGVDVDWTGGPIALRPSWVGADGVRVRVDLRGGPPLGRLTSAVQTFLNRSDQTQVNAPPRMTVSDLHLGFETPLGLIETSGGFVSVGPGAFEGRLAADGASLETDHSRLALRDGEVRFRRQGDDLSIDGLFHADRLDLPGVRSEALELSLTARQDRYGLRASWSGAAGAMDVSGFRMSGARIRGEADGAGINLSAPSLSAFVQSLDGVRLEGEGGEGGVGELSWDRSRLRLDLAEREGEKRIGTLDVRLEEIASSGLSAETGAVQGRVSVSTAPRSLWPVRLDADGEVRIGGLTARPEFREDLTRVFSPLAAMTSPGMGSAISDAIVRAIRKSDIEAPWSAHLDEAGLQATLKGPMQLSSFYPFNLDIRASDASPLVMSWSPSKGLSWGVAAEVETSGEGPRVDILIRAEGDPSRGITAEIDGELEPWRIGGGLLEVSLDAMRLSRSGNAGAATGGVALSYSGELVSGSIENARLEARMNAIWSGSGSVIDAVAPPDLSWDRLNLGEAVISQGSALLLVDGPLAQKGGSVWAGDGRLVFKPMKAEIAGASGVMTPGTVAIDWTFGEAWAARLSMEASRLVLEGGNGTIEADLSGLSGSMRMGREWSLNGGVEGGKVRTDTLLADSLEGRFRLHGDKDGFEGDLRDVMGEISDPSEAEDRMFEAVRFSGQASVSRDGLDFSAVTRLTSPDLELVTLSGRHDFRSGHGKARIAPARLQFRPRGFQPSDLSARLRGPANVSGQVEVSGEALWSSDDFNLSLSTELQGVGFAIASAGVFEDVSGRIEISDLFEMRSPPGQTIRIGKVTFGVPFEDGDIRFQLLDFDTLRLEAAQFPFAAGAIVVRPMDYEFGADRNLIVAEADRWDLTEMVRLFGVPDLEVEGVLSGTIPLSFTTGSARVEDAVLEASGEGGVIRYTGEAGQAAGDADPNARLVFEALEDFRYSRLRVGLMGDITGRITLSLGLLGKNPGVLGGTDFDLNIGVESELMNLIQSFQSDRGLSSVIRAAPPLAKNEESPLPRD